MKRSNFKGSNTMSSFSLLLARKIFVQTISKYASASISFAHFFPTNMENSPPKKPKTTIGTHDGIFHCDEVLACFMLQQLPEYSGAQILRTRDDELLKKCDLVVDVGSVFNKDLKRFDHHQSTFQHTLSTLRPELGNKFNIRLSSAGLIYTFYGEDVLRAILHQHGSTELSDDLIRQVYLQVYENLIKEIDGIDNGVPMFDGEPAFNISTHLSSRVGRFNATWNVDNAKFDAMAQFELAQKLAGSELIDSVLYYASAWWPARTIVANAIAKRFDVHPSGEILELEQFCPWKEHLNLLEDDLHIVGQPKYVIMENKPGDFRVICVPNTPKSFVCRKFLHKHWRGLRDVELQNVSGIPDASFVHATGFIGGAKNRESVLEMAVKSLKSQVEEA